MRSSIAIASLCAALVAAVPLEKRGIEVVEDVKVVTNVVAVTVTAEPVVVTVEATSPAPVAASPSTAAGRHRHSHSQPASAPAPTSTSAPVVVVTKTQVAEVSIPYTSSAVVVPATTSAVVVAPTSSAVASSVAASATNALSPTAVAAHNAARASHSASAMVWNETLAGYAAQEGSCTKFAHDLTAGGGGYGQNIAVAGSSSSTAHTPASALADSISEWYAEESLYTALYGQANPDQSVGDFLHFTQIVWEASTSVGCAVIECPTSNSIYSGMYVWYTVCNYYPAGNVLGEFNTNVLS